MRIWNLEMKRQYKRRGMMHSVKMSKATFRYSGWLCP